MIDFGRQASLNGRRFETLAQAIAHKDPEDVQAIIAFDAEAVTGEPRPADLFHDEIERLRATAEYQACLPKISEGKAKEMLEREGYRVAAVVAHDNGLVTATAILPTVAGPSDRQRIQQQI